MFKYHFITSIRSNSKAMQWDEDLEIYTLLIILNQQGLTYNISL